MPKKRTVILISAVLVFVTLSCSKEKIGGGLETSLDYGMITIAIETNDVITTQEIPFETSYEDDASMAAGASVTKQQGKNGIKEITFRIFSIDGVERNRTIVNETITAQPVSQIIARGTAGYGSTGSSAAPADQTQQREPGVRVVVACTAECNDGTLDMDANKNNLCVGHGGIRILYDSNCGI